MTDRPGARGVPAAARVGLAGVAITLAVAAAAAYQDWQHRERLFRAEATAAFDRFQDRLDTHLARMRAVAASVRSGDSDPGATPAPGAASLAWVERAANGDTAHVAGPAADAVVAEVMVADSGASAAPRATLERALETGELAVTPGPVPLRGDGADPGVLAFAPTLDASGRRGAVALALRLDALTDAAGDGRRLALHVFDNRGSAPRFLLHGPGASRGVAPRADPEAAAGGLHMQREVPVGDRTWTLLATPSPALAWLPASALWLALAGLGLTGTASALVQRATRRSRALRQRLAAREERLDALGHEITLAREAHDREAAARAAAERGLQLLEDHVTDLVLRVAGDGTILSASASAGTRLGYAPKALRGQALDALLAETPAPGTGAPPPDADTPGYDGGVNVLLRDAGGHLRHLRGVAVALPAAGPDGDQTLFVLAPPATTADRQALPFRAAFDDAAVGMAFFHPETGHCLHVNQALGDLLGYAQDELRRMTYLDLTHPADQRATREQLRQLRGAMRDTFQVEKRYLHKSGRVLWVLVSGSLVRGDDGRVACVASQIRDITERKETERALQATNRRLDLILNAAAEAIIGLDGQGRVVFANRAAEALLDRDAASLEGEPLERLMAPAAPDATAAPFALADLPDARVRHEEGRLLRRADGSTFVADYTAAPMLEDGRVTGAVVVMSDASARQEGEARFRSAFEEVPVGMALIGLDGRFLRANAALCNLVGYDHAELLALPSRHLLHTRDRAPNRETNRRVLDGGHAGAPLEQRLCHRDGGLVWALTSTSVIRDPGGAPLYLLKHTQDITARKVAEASVRNGEARFRGVFDRTVVGMAVLATEHARVERVNNVLRERLRCDGDAFIERPFSDFVHPDDRSAFAAALGHPPDPAGTLLTVRLRGCRGDEITVRLRITRIDDAAPGAEILHLLQLAPPDDEPASVRRASAPPE